MVAVPFLRKTLHDDRKALRLLLCSLFRDNVRQPLSPQPHSDRRLSGGIDLLVYQRCSLLLSGANKKVLRDKSVDYRAVKADAQTRSDLERRARGDASSEDRDKPLCDTELVRHRLRHRSGRAFWALPDHGRVYAKRC